MFNHTFYLNFFRINLLCQSYLLFKRFVSLTILPVILFFFTFTFYLIIPLSLSPIPFTWTFIFLITQQVYLSYLLNNLLVSYFLSFPFSSSNTSNLLFFSFIFYSTHWHQLVIMYKYFHYLIYTRYWHFYCLIVIHTSHLSLHFSYSCSTQVSIIHTFRSTYNYLSLLIYSWTQYFVHSFLSFFSILFIYLLYPTHHHCGIPPS